MGISPISPISGYSAYGGISGIYPAYNTAAVRGVSAAQRVNQGTDGTAQATVDGAKDAQQSKAVKQANCQTCKNRKYVDGSNEGDVSFKAPAHIDPRQSAAVVMSHEQEHVANARAEGSKENKELLSVSVTLHTSVCPECGRVYVSGGNTHTTMKTTKENGNGNEEDSRQITIENNNPYAKGQKKLAYLLSAGANFDLSA